MRIEYDPAKSERNAAERGLPFSVVAELDWTTAQTSEDIRFSYPERRWVSVGFVGKRLHVVCYAPTPGGIRVISLRKANDREVRRYEQRTAD